MASNRSRSEMQILSPRGISSALLALLLLALTPAQGPPPSLGTSEQLVLCPGELVLPEQTAQGAGRGWAGVCSLRCPGFQCRCLALCGRSCSLLFPLSHPTAEFS